ncbi:MAG TPA: CoA pyrophosphatase [Dehalococcoidia bacterium]|nr:CoA pyrophosphatase [Dehalococcoidia bacterium]
MKERLKEALSGRKKLHIRDAGRKSSAVLLPLYIKDGEYHLLFIQRTNRVRDHKGQISFPGGAYEEGDNTFQKTALRETSEEVGVDEKDVEVLGELDDIITIGSSYIISPFVGTIPWPYDIRVDRWETEEIIEVPLAALLDSANVREETDILDSRIVPAYFYHYEGKVIWGATARILHQFLGIVDSIR